MAVAAEGRWQTGIRSISEGVRYIHGTKDFSDVTFIVRGEYFKAHKLILASRSTEFARLLMTPNSSDEHVVNRPSPVTAAGFKILLRFIYTNELDVTDKKAIAEAYIAAKYYKQKALQARCQEKIESWVISKDDVCDFLDVDWDMPDLKDKCISFIQNNGLEVISSDAFAEASFNSVAVILESGALRDVPVLQRIEYFMKWGRKHFGSPTDDYSLVRKKLMETQPNLLGKLGFQDLSLQEIPEILLLYPELLTHEEVTKFLLYSTTKDVNGLPHWCTENN